MRLRLMIIRQKKADTPNQKFIKVCKKIAYTPNYQYQTLTTERRTSEYI